MHLIDEVIALRILRKVSGKQVKRWLATSGQLVGC